MLHNCAVDRESCISAVRGSGAGFVSLAAAIPDKQA